jgi:CCR4-NOT transcription complex subunit 4
LKVVVNTANGYQSTDSREQTYGAYITFAKASEASLAILAIDGKTILNNCLRATYGSTKFCTYYLKGKECNNKECLYLHSEPNDQDDILERDDINNRTNFKTQQLQAIKIANIFNFEIRKKIMMAEKIPNTVFPSITTTYDNPVVYDNDLNHREFQIYFEKELEKERETRSMPRNNPENSKSRDTSKDNENDQHSSVSDKKYVSDSYSESDHHAGGLVSKPDFEIEISKLENHNNNNNNQNELNSNNLKSSISTTDSITEPKESVRLFKSKSNSRFSFTGSDILDEPNDDGITIPTFVSKIIQNNMIKNNKKIYKLLEKSVLENLIQNNNNNNNSNNSISHNWASFINETTTQNDESP